MITREQIWKNLFEAKYLACYYFIYSRLLNMISWTISIFLAVTTCGAIATWQIWESYPKIWIIIIGISQLVILLKPLIPEIHSSTDYKNISVKLEYLYLDYEKLLFDYDQNVLNHTEISDEFFKLRQKDLRIATEFKTAPNFKFIQNKAYENCENDLGIQFNLNP